MKEIAGQAFRPLDCLERLTRLQWFAFAAIMLLAAFARFYLLDRIPPGLWYDEALYSLDGYGVSQGHFSLFFSAHGHPREPLFPWLLGAAFALFQPTVLVARCVCATCGTLAVALLFFVARRFFSPWWALAAVAAFAVFRWHIHFSRVIFRADLASLMILLVVWLFFRWRERRRPVDAILCGVAVAGCLYVYISLRIVPFLVAFWIVWLAMKHLLSLKTEWKQIALLFGTALVVFAPLASDYVRNPEHLFGRTEEVSMFEKTVNGERVPKSVGEAVAGIAQNAWGVAKVWFVRGDYVARHGIPYRPIFDPITGLFFFIGIVLCLWSVLRRGSADGFVLLSWFGGFAMASVFSFGAPNVLRMQGASPVVVFIMILGLRQTFLVWPSDRLRFVRQALPACVLLFFAATQLNDYFRVFPNDTRVRAAFGADIFYAPAKAADQIATKVENVYVPRELMDALQVQFVTIRHKNIVGYSPDKPLPVSRSAAWLVTMRSIQLSGEAGVDQAEQLRHIPGATEVDGFSIPQTGEDGVVYNQPWAELWVAW